MNYPLTLQLFLNDVEVWNTEIDGSNLLFLDDIKNTPGEYTYKVSEFDDQQILICEQTGTFYIPNLTTEESLLCESECEIINFDPNGNSNNGDDCFVLIDEDGNIISTNNGETEICGQEEEQEFVSVIKNNKGEIIEIKKVTFKSANSDITIKAEKKMLCSGDKSDLTCLGNNIVSYEWSTGETTSTITVTSAGEYRITVLDTEGCEIERSIEIFDQSQLPEFFHNQNYECIPFEYLTIDPSYEITTQNFDANCYLTGSINGYTIDINQQFLEMLDMIYNSNTGIFGEIIEISTCDDIEVLQNGSQSNTRSNEWFLPKVITLKSIDFDNNNIYIKREYNLKEEGQAQIYLSNLIPSLINTEKVIIEAKYFNKLINLSIPIQNALPVLSDLAENQSICIIGNGFNQITKFMLGNRNIGSNVPLGLWCDYETNYLTPLPPNDFTDQVLFDESPNPFILMNYAAMPKAKTKWTNAADDNKILSNEPRILGFLHLHGEGHNANILHGKPSIYNKFIEGFGFMYEGDFLNYSLSDPESGFYSQLESPTFEGLIKWTIKNHPNHISAIKSRYSD